MHVTGKREPQFDKLVEEQPAREWRQLALGMGALLAQKPECHAEMLGEVARELKSPVATLRATAERLEQTAADQSGPLAARDLAVRVAEQADVISHWVDAILDIQRMRLGKVRLDMQKLDLVDFARRSAEFIQRTLPGVEVRVVASRSVVISADEARLKSALVSLAHNASGSARGHRIVLRVGVYRWALGGPRVMLSVRTADRNLASEDAPAMADQDVPHDLDLLVAREIIALHRGELWSDSCGGTAIIILPTTAPEDCA